MKQAVKNERNGQVMVTDVPIPVLKPGWIHVANRFSLISAGTERSTIETAERGLLEEARARPELLRKLTDRVRKDGLSSTVGMVRQRLDAARVDSLSGLGYSSAGVVVAVGSGVHGLAPGDRVACGGAGWASHAEIVSVPRNLIAKVPSTVALDAAAYATVGAIALHAVRQVDVNLGERVGVIGLGLVGQLTVRILTAAGCDAIGVDLDPVAVELARSTGAQAFLRSEPTLEAAIREATDGLGLDGVLVCAATTSSDPLQLAARLARDRGTVVVVGDVPVTVERALLYKKELKLCVSRSYGPGRYDREYEERGKDLPAGYVRWTEQRNLKSFVDMIAGGRLDPSSLTTHRFAIDSAADAYALLTDPTADPRPFGILLEYDLDPDDIPSEVAKGSRVFVSGRLSTQSPRVGLIGAGAFARSTLLPALKAEGARLVTVATERGVTAVDVANRFDFESAASSPEEIIESAEIDAVVIATRHGDHATLATAALSAGKAVFVEKPLALTPEELNLVEAAARGRILMVGFNRRFAPLAERMRVELGQVVDKVLVARINAGHLPSEHWLHDPDDGGGRLLGEGCHFVDLLAYIAGSRIVSVYAVAVPQPERPLECSDSLVATLQFEDGGVASLIYSGRGAGRLPKERVEAFGGGSALVLDDFSRLEIHRGNKPEVFKGRQDKGHRAEVAHFLQAVTGVAEAPPLESYLGSTRATLALAESLRAGGAVSVGRSHLALRPR